MDYCVRTTNRNVSMCRNLSVPLSRLPSYPPGMSPRRQLSVTLMYLTPDYFTNLQQFFHSLPQASLQRLSLSARVKARVRLTRTPDDDSFEVLEILAAPVDSRSAKLRSLEGRPDEAATGPSRTQQTRAGCDAAR